MNFNFLINLLPFQKESNIFIYKNNSLIVEIKHIIS